MFEEQEVVNLIVGALGLVVLAFVGRKGDAPGSAVLKAGYACIVAGHVFTIVEGFLWHGLFNLLEHASFAAGGVLLAFGLQRLSRQREAADGAEP